MCWELSEQPEEDARRKSSRRRQCLSHPLTQLAAPSLCISKSLHCTALQGLAPPPRAGTSAARVLPGCPRSCTLLQANPGLLPPRDPRGLAGSCWVCSPEPILQPPQHTHTQGISKNSMAQAEAINQLPSRISSQPRAEPSVPGISNIIKGGEAGRRDRHRLVKYFRKGKKMGELVLVGHTSHNSWTHNLKKALELLFA